MEGIGTQKPEASLSEKDMPGFVCVDSRRPPAVSYSFVLRCYALTQGSNSFVTVRQPDKGSAAVDLVEESVELKGWEVRKVNES